MATKKYIDDASFKLEAGTFRTLMGQYWYIGRAGNLVYGEPGVFRELPNPGEGVYEPGDVGRSVPIFYSSGLAHEAERQIDIRRIQPDTGGADIDVVVAIDEGVGVDLGLVKKLQSGGSELYLKVTSTKEVYPSALTFSNDLDVIFENRIGERGTEQWTYETSFTTEYYNEGDEEISVTSKYNFFSENYENAISSASETSIPNIYALDGLSAEGADGLNFDAGNLANHVLVLGKIPRDDLTKGSSFYVEKWAENYKELTSDETQTLETLGKNVIRTYSSLANEEGSLPGTLEDEGKARAPFYIEISAPAHELNSIPLFGTEHGDWYLRGGDLTWGVTRDGDMLTQEDDANLVDIVGDLTTTWTSQISYVMDPSVALGPAVNDYYGFHGFNYYTKASGTNPISLDSSRVFDFELDHDTIIDESYTPQTGKTTHSLGALAYGAINFGEYFDDGTSVDPRETFDLSRKLILDSDSTEKLYAVSLGQNSVSEALYFGIEFRQKLVDYFISVHFNNSLVSIELDDESLETQTQSLENFLTLPRHPGDEGRAYKEIFENYAEKAANPFTQTICYGIDKYRGDKETGQYVQTIWVPNNGDALNYIDSQVRYGQKYTYDVNAYKYVFGTRYKYVQHEAPRESFIEEVVDTGGYTIGYTITYDGAKNLFWKTEAGNWVWAEVAVKANREYMSTGNYDLFEELYEGGMRPGDDWWGLGAGIDPEHYKSFGEKNTYFFTIAELNDLFEIAWNVRPTDYKGRSYDSWADIWPGYTWGRDLEITEETAPGLRDRTNFVKEGSPPLGELDPTTFTITQWFKLFFGAGDGAEFVFETGDVPGVLGVGSYRINETQQGYPPSHHLLHAWGIENGELDGLWTGFEQPETWRGKYPSDPEWRNVPWSRGTYTRLDRWGLSPPYEYVGLKLYEAGEVFSTESTEWQAQYKIAMKPATRIVKVPYFTASGIVLSNPPPPPEVSITPYRAINNNLLFSFDANFTKQEAIPVAIEPGEKELIEGYYSMQDVIPGRKITFESDDIPALFQVYRLDSPPNSYSDFAGNFRADVSTLIPDPEKVIRATSATYVESLQPNIKYYYTFRTIDFHGNPSNPTVVYEIELVDDGGAVYPLIQTYEFPIIDTHTSSIAMKKLIEIIPSLNQVTAKNDQNIVDAEGVAYESPTDVGDIRLGSEDLVDPIWDKTFKIRLTSKKTGKKIDFNVTFKTEDERVED